jgi:hypothetical protein
MPSRGAMGIIQGFDRILIQFAIFWTRKVHPLTQFSPGSAYSHMTWSWGTSGVQGKGGAKNNHMVFLLHSMGAAKCHWHGLQKLVMPLHRGR